MRMHSHRRVCSLRFFILGVLLLLVAFQMGCSHWRDDYFDDGVGEVTQDDVRKKLGKPHIVKDPFLSEETTWIYRYGVSETELDPIGVKSIGQGVNLLGETAASIVGKGGGDQGGKRERVLCIRYVLTFDGSKVLRDWKREPCQNRRRNKVLGSRS